MGVINAIWSEPSTVEFESALIPLGRVDTFFQPFVASGVDATYSPTGFASDKDLNKIYLTSPVGLTTLWIHFSIKTAATNAAEQGSTPINGIPSIIFYHNGQQQYRMGRGNASATNWYFQKTLNNGSTWTQVGTFAVIPFATLMEIDIKIVISATVGEYFIYKDGVLMTSFSGDTSCTNNLISLITLGSGVSVLSTNNNIYSQIILADENTVGWKLQTLKISAGSDANFLGDFSRVNLSSYKGASDKSVSTDIPNARISFDTNNTVVNSLVVDSVWVAGRHIKVGASSVNNSQLLLKVGGIDYVDATLISAKVGKEEVIKQKWTANPSNSSGWTKADVDALQIGLKVSA
jgi:hypothetical protein